MQNLCVKFKKVLIAEVCHNELNAIAGAIWIFAEVFETDRSADEASVRSFQRACR